MARSTWRSRSRGRGVLPVAFSEVRGLPSSRDLTFILGVVELTDCNRSRLICRRRRYGRPVHRDGVLQGQARVERKVPARGGSVQGQGGWDQGGREVQVWELSAGVGVR